MHFNDNEYHHKLSLKEWGSRMTQGWDRTGTNFSRMRYQYFGPLLPHPLARNPDNAAFFSAELWEELKAVRRPAIYERMPLRYKMKGFQFSKSQRTILRRNDDLTFITGPCLLTDEKHKLFIDWHDYRFGYPRDISTWVAGEKCPFRSNEIAVYDKDELIACSFFDTTPSGQYSTIACYNPNERKRSLGTLTLLLEIQNTAAKNKVAHYPGYTFVEESMLDYKKNFHNVERYDWETQKWQKLILP